MHRGCCVLEGHNIINDLESLNAADVQWCWGMVLNDMVTLIYKADTWSKTAIKKSWIILLNPMHPLTTLSAGCSLWYLLTQSTLLVMTK